MTDVEKMYGTCEIIKANDEVTILRGSAPMATMRSELTSHTKDLVNYFVLLRDYEPCHNAESHK